MDTKVKERPIIFSACNASSIRNGTKTMTRRVVKNQPEWATRFESHGSTWIAYQDDSGKSMGRCPYGQPGDRLWVREPFIVLDADYRVVDRLNGERWPNVEYSADHPLGPPARDCRWRSPIHMPRWAAKTVVEVESIRVERLQDITDEDVRAEGHFSMTSEDGMSGWGAWPKPPPKYSDYTFRNTFRHSWDNKNADRGFPWDANHWVWVVKFRRVI